MSKGAKIVHLYGEVDELNSFFGLAISKMKASEQEKEYLYFLQSRLFDIGSYLACEIEKREKLGIKEIQPLFVAELEERIDHHTLSLAPLKEFILPGGNEQASLFHVCRSVCRRLERQLVEVAEESAQQVGGNTLTFINRLSDFFFVLARIQTGTKDERRWVKARKDVK